MKKILLVLCSIGLILIFTAGNFNSLTKNVLAGKKNPKLTCYAECNKDKRSCEDKVKKTKFKGSRKERNSAKKAAFKKCRDANKLCKQKCKKL